MTTSSVRIGAEATGQETAVEQGLADVMLDAPTPDDLSTIARRFPTQTHAFPSHEILAMFLNTRLPPFDRLSVRHALNLAVDRSEIVRQAGGTARARPTCQILPPGFPGYRPTCPHTARPDASGAWRAPDLARARMLVRRSGTAGMLVTVSTITNDPLKLRTAQYVVRVLEQLGFRSSLRTYTGSHPYYRAVGLTRSRSQIGVMGWYPDYQAGSAFFQPLLTCAAFQPETPFMLNKAGFCDRRIDAHIQSATALEGINSTAANAAWRAVDREIARAAPWVPLVAMRQVDFVSRRVENYQRHPVFGMLLEQLWLDARR